MNFTIVENPYKGENSVITTRGVMTDAKIAKLNNSTKKPAIVKNWENAISALVTTNNQPKDYKAIYSEVFNKENITVVNEASKAEREGAKKLKTIQIVGERVVRGFNIVDRVDVIPEKVELPKVEEKPPVSINNSFDINDIGSREEIHGKHGHTGEISLTAINEVRKNDMPSIANTSSLLSRAERNANVGNDIKQESMGGNMDEYNKLVHGTMSDDDVSRQLQGARNQLSAEKEESKKLAEQFGEAVKKIERLKEDIETTKKQKEQRVKQELNSTLREIETVQKENLEKTRDLTSLHSEIAKLEAQKRAIEESLYEG